MYTFQEFWVSKSRTKRFWVCIWLQFLTTTPSKRLQITQAQLQEISYAPEHNQETSNAQAQLQETSYAPEHNQETSNAQAQLQETSNSIRITKKNVWGWTLDIQSVVFTIQIRYKLFKTLEFIR